MYEEDYPTSPYGGVFTPSSVAADADHCQRQDVGRDGPLVWSRMAIPAFLEMFCKIKLHLNMDLIK